MPTPTPPHPCPPDTPQLRCVVSRGYWGDPQASSCHRRRWARPVSDGNTRNNKSSVVKLAIQHLNGNGYALAKYPLPASRVMQAMKPAAAFSISWRPRRNQTNPRLSVQKISEQRRKKNGMSGATCWLGETPTSPCLRRRCSELQQDSFGCRAALKSETFGLRQSIGSST